MKPRLIAATAALAAAALFAAPASALTQDLGTLDATGSSFSNWFARWFDQGTPLGGFSDYYTFDLLGAAGAAGGTVVFEFGFLDLALNSVSLSGGTLPSTLVDNTPSSFSFGGLGAGTYTLAINGTLSGWSGAAGYRGNIQAIASPAPEPETLAMLLAGLGAVGFFGNRNRNRNRKS